MHKLSIGVIGSGGIAQDVHLPLLCRLSEFSPVWVCDIDKARARACANRFGIPQYFSDLAECSDVDAVLVATPVGSRRRILDVASERKWHAFCEKPFALNVSEHQEMLTHASQTQRVLSAGFMRRFYQSTIAARDIFRSLPSAGPVEVIASDATRIRRNPHSSDWYLSDPNSSGGGFLMETGSHLVDQVLSALDTPYTETLTSQQTTYNGIDYETSARAAGRLRDGRRLELLLLVSRLRDLWTGIRISTFDFHIDLAAYPGAAVVVTNRVRGTQFEVPSALGPDQDLTNAYATQLKNFATRVHSGDVDGNAVETGFETTSFLRNCYEKTTLSRALDKVS